MRFLIIFIFIIVHLSVGNELGYSTSSSFYTHLTYQFQHLNWIHLTFNSISFVAFFKILQKVYPGYLIILYTYFISFAVSFFSEYHLPTVGSSAMIYAMIGLFLSLSIIGDKLHIVNHKKFIVLIIGILVSLIISYYKNSANNVCHILALVIGLISGVLDYKFNKA